MQPIPVAESVMSTKISPKIAEKLECAAPRRRSDRAHHAILDAVWHRLAEVGYNDLTIESVAQRANVGKATIYRWWPSKGSMVAEAIARHLDVGPEPDTGNTREDLRIIVAAAVKNFHDTVAGETIPALVADLIHEGAQTMEAFRRDFLVPRRDASKVVLRRAIERGDLHPDTDLDLVLDIYAGAIFYRVLMGLEPVSHQIIDQLVTLILDGELPRRSVTDRTRSRQA